MANYRQQSGGSLGSLTTCPTCYDTLFIIKGSGVTNICCDSASAGASPTYETKYVAQGTTFETATMFYDDTALTTPSGNGWWSDEINVGSRTYRALTRDPGGNNPTLGSVTACDTCSTQSGGIKESSATVGDNTAYDACCGNDQPGLYRLPYGKTFLNSPKIYANNDTTLSTPLTGFFFRTGDGKVKQFNGASPAGQPVDCATCFETLTGIRYSNTEAEDVCCDVTATGTYYAAQGETFATATTLYTDQALTTVAPGGFYSND
tara:strand:+ start:10287 stop:11075 length:789 start_codon:yes stop_codon:yes gene_type:complete